MIHIFWCIHVPWLGFLPLLVKFSGPLFTQLRSHNCLEAYCSDGTITQMKFLGNGLRYHTWLHPDWKHSKVIEGPQVGPSSNDLPFWPDSTTVDSTRYSWILYTKLTLESFAFDPNFQQLPHWYWLVRWMVNLSEHKDPHPLGIRINAAPWSQPESITAAASSRVGIPNALNRSICTVVSVSSENIISICAPGMAFLSQSM